MTILSSRPKGMTFEDYRDHLREQKRWLKFKRKHGSICYIASEPTNRFADPLHF